MTLAIRSLLLGFGQLRDPAVLRVLAKSLVLTVLVFVTLGVGLYFGLVFWFDEMGLSDSGMAGAATAALLALISFWFLFRVVALAVLQFFADEVVQAVERKHYPDAMHHARALPFREDLSNSLKGVGRALLFNLIALPVALVLLFTAIGPAVVFLLVNSVLLGRELTDMAWLRHRPEPSAIAPVGAGQRLILGACVAGLMLVPFVNLLAPIIGAAAGTHMVHIRREQLDANA
ncbi:MAG: EI24 domain-containing protein [Erythrobacter sp.]